MPGRNEYIVGIEEAIKVLDVLPDKIKNAQIRKVASQSIRPVQAQAKVLIRSAQYPNRKHSQQKDDFSHRRLLARGVRREMLRKGGQAGARVITKGPNIPMGKRDWRPQGVAKLFSAGAYKNPNRKGKGRFKGFGNWIVKAGEQRHNQVTIGFRRGLESVAGAARDITIAQHGRKG